MREGPPGVVKMHSFIIPQKNNTSGDTLMTRTATGGDKNKMLLRGLRRTPFFGRGKGGGGRERKESEREREEKGKQREKESEGREGERVRKKEIERQIDREGEIRTRENG